MTTAERQSPAYVVVDASVSLKWALDDEEHVDNAVALRDAALGGGFLMVAPSVWSDEVTNGLVTAARRGRLDPDQGLQAVGDLHSLNVQLLGPEPADVYVQSLRYDVAAYDAAYLVVAEALDTVMWTGDRRFYEAVHAATDRVRWIGDFPTDVPP